VGEGITLDLNTPTMQTNNTSTPETSPMVRKKNWGLNILTYRLY